MKRILFEFSLTSSVVQSDREQFNIAELDNRGLRRIAYGKISITECQQKVVVLIESEVLDYAVQLRGVIDEIDSGNYETFTVSGDYFSNNFRFTYNPLSKELEIYEVNGGSFRITLPYNQFRSSTFAFYNQLLSDLQLLYPELIHNREYLAMIESSLDAHT